MAFQPLLTRLTRQLSAKGVPDARNEAVDQLRGFGLMYQKSEKLTKKGEVREAMGPAKRAIDRAAKRAGRPMSDYKYVGGRAILK